MVSCAQWIPGMEVKVKLKKNLVKRPNVGSYFFTYFMRVFFLNAFFLKENGCKCGSHYYFILYEDVCKVFEVGT